MILSLDANEAEFAYLVALFEQLLKALLKCFVDVHDA